MIGGVCEMLEKETNLNAWLFRLLFLFSLGYGGLLVYLLIWLFKD